MHPRAYPSGYLLKYERTLNPKTRIMVMSIFFLRWRKFWSQEEKQSFSHNHRHGTESDVKHRYNVCCSLLWLLPIQSCTYDLNAIDRLVAPESCMPIPPGYPYHPGFPYFLI